jgi:hypothetical protein
MQIIPPKYKLHALNFEFVAATGFEPATLRVEI